MRIVVSSLFFLPAFALAVVGGSSPTRSVYNAVISFKSATQECTGTFLNDTTVLTARHCLQGSAPSIQGIAAVNFFALQRATSKEAKHPVDLQNIIYANDVALVVFPPGTASRLGITEFPKIARRRAEKGSVVRFVGFGMRRLELQFWGVADFRGIKLVGSNTIERRSYYFYELKGLGLPRNEAEASRTDDSAAGPGDSGGPIFNEEGELIGITSSIGGDVLDSKSKPFTYSYFSMLHRQEVARLFTEAQNCDSNEMGPCAERFDFPMKLRDTEDLPSVFTPYKPF